MWLKIKYSTKTELYFLRVEMPVYWYKEITK